MYTFCSSSANVLFGEEKKAAERAASSQMTSCCFKSYRQQRAHQQPLNGRQTKVRPSPQTGPTARQETVSTAEKFLVTPGRFKVPTDVVASAVKAKAPASSMMAAAAIANATWRMFPS